MPGARPARNGPTVPVPGPDATHVREQLDTIAAMLGRQLPKVEQMLRDAAEDILACASFPVLHWKKIWSTNPLSVNRLSGDTITAAA
jgi:putative transposase